MKVATDLFFCDIHLSVMDYWKREKKIIEQDLVLSIRCWLEFEMWVLQSKINMSLQLIVKFLGPAYVTREKSVILPEDWAFW